MSDNIESADFFKFVYLFDAPKTPNTVFHVFEYTEAVYHGIDPQPSLGQHGENEHFYSVLKKIMEQCIREVRQSNFTTTNHRKESNTKTSVSLEKSESVVHAAPTTVTELRKRLLENKFIQDIRT